MSGMTTAKLKVGPRGGETTITTSGMLRKTVYFAREEWQAIRQRAYGLETSATDVIREAVREQLAPAQPHRGRAEQGTLALFEDHSAA